MKVIQNFITRSSRFLRCTAVVVAAVLAIGGCNAIRLGYSNGEMLTYWWLNNYIDVSANQKPWLKKNIAALFNWHRHTQLPDYIHLLASLQQQLQQSQPVTPQALLLTLGEVKKRALVVIDHAMPELAELALSLKPHQIAQMEEKFASNNAKYRKDYLSGDVEQRQRFRYKKVMEQAQYWFGDFSREQEALIRRVLDAQPLQHDLWLAQRQHRQRELIALLKKIQAERPGHDAVMAQLRAYTVTMIERGGSAEHEKMLSAAQDQVLGLTATVINSTTPKQKLHAHKRMQQWMDDFRTLAAPNTNAQAAAETGR